MKIFPSRFGILFFVQFVIAISPLSVGYNIVTLGEKKRANYDLYSQWLYNPPVRGIIQPPIPRDKKGRITSNLPDHIPNADRARLNHLRINPAQMELLPFRRIDELQRLHAEAL